MQRRLLESSVSHHHDLHEVGFTLGSDWCRLWQGQRESGCWATLLNDDCEGMPECVPRAGILLLRPCLSQHLVRVVGARTTPLDVKRLHGADLAGSCGRATRTNHCVLFDVREGHIHFHLLVHTAT